MTESKSFVRLAIGLATISLFLAMLAIGIAQEKPPRETRQWVLSRIGDHIDTYQRVVAIDTDGVCLYVVTNEFSVETAIAAVPKTQLPKGAGCQ